MNDYRPGSVYAFNEPAEELYNLICQELRKSIKKDGVIDTVGVFRSVKQKIIYKYSDEIVSNLFKSPLIARMINSLFLEFVGTEGSNELTPEPLYSVAYAYELMLQDNRIK